MLLTITSTTEPATDLGFLLHKNPARLHEIELSFGIARICYPQASEERCTAALIVAGGIALAGERVRPADFRRLGIVFAVLATIMFAIRDNLLRWLVGETDTHALVTAPVTLLAGSGTVALYLAATRGRAWARGYRVVVRAFFPAGVLFGLSYAALFEAYYRGRVTVVAPLVATESLWGVIFAALLLRRSELVGRRLVAGAALIVAGGALIGAWR
jgi:drug/metabolite transporter (DMT)-like permease